MDLIWGRRRGRDIELPAEGKRDPRLPAKPDVRGAFRQAGKGLKQARELSQKSRSQSKGGR
jgi:hypothetical protein